MKIIKTTTELRRAIFAHKRISLVPTMGNLHAGHLRLVELAKQHADCVVVSIFVNPLQFGPNEDLENYHRTLEEDCEKLNNTGATIVFAPSVIEMYPGFDGKSLNQGTTINLPPIANELCGANRPGHFTGVATVITKLFNIIQPNVAILGKKDFQQLFIIKKLIRQLNFQVELIAAETVREHNGLAMSSRNNNFSADEKIKAAQLNLTLREVVKAVQLKPHDFAKIEQNAMDKLSKQGWLVDYIAIRSSITLQPASKVQKNLVVLGAAKLSNTRLIDNIEFELHE